MIRLQNIVVSGLIEIKKRKIKKANTPVKNSFFDFYGSL